VPDHSIADWSYTVSEAVASYSVTGLIGFVVVKELRLSERANRIAWRDVVKTAGVAVILTMLGFLPGSWLGGDSVAR
jgi:hypothetical protein